MGFCNKKIIINRVRVFFFFFKFLTFKSPKTIVEFVKNKVPNSKSSVTEADALSVLKAVRFYYVDVNL